MRNCIKFLNRLIHRLFRLRTLDLEIREAVREDKSTRGDGRESLQEAQQSIQELFTKIKDIKLRSEKSEEMVSSQTHSSAKHSRLSFYGIL